MTDREKAIVMAYTGYCMLAGDKLSVFYEYVESIMGRPVYTHEMAIKAVDDEIKEKAKADFIALCAEQEPCDDAISRQAMHIELEKWITYGEYKYSNATKYLYDRIDRLPSVKQEPKTGHWEWVQYDANPEIGNFHCSECRYIPAIFNMSAQKLNYCPKCGAKMAEGEE